MKKTITAFFYTLTLFILYLFLPFITQKQIFAATSCELKETTPSPVTTNNSHVSLKISSDDLSNGIQYWVTLNGHNISTNPTEFISLGNPYTLDGNILTVPNVGPNAEADYEGTDTFSAGRYSVTVTDSKVGGTTHCTGLSFTVQEVVKEGECSIVFNNETFTPDDDINISILNAPASYSLFRVILLREQLGGQVVNNQIVESSNIINISLGKHESGVYWVDIHDPCAAPFIACSIDFMLVDGPSLCAKPFQIVPSTSGGGGVIDLANASTPASSFSVCTLEGNRYVCKTAIGDISTDPKEFVQSIFGIILSLSGGIALIIIIISGYTLMTSQGNPEKIQGAKETLTSAIVGLLFIIFSLVILQVVGYDILRIPGFSP